MKKQTDSVANVIHLPVRNQGWTSEELVAVEEIITSHVRIHAPVELERIDGRTEEGEPWTSLNRVIDGEQVLSLARERQGVVTRYYINTPSRLEPAEVSSLWDYHCRVCHQQCPVELRLKRRGA